MRAGMTEINMKSSRILWAGIAVLVVAAWAGASEAADNNCDNGIDAARRYVEKSDRYLHHSQLTRGMKGYGLSVFEGTKIEKFDVEIVSVMTQWGPHQDVILAKLSGKGLEKSGVISGMSGSPVYVTGPDGKDRMIGAVAYGWPLMNEPLCGIQPITQMLAGTDIIGCEKPQTQPALPTTAPFETASTAGGDGGSQLDESFMRALVAPQKIDFIKAYLDTQKLSHDQPAGLKLSALSTPLMVSGMSSRTVAAMGGNMSPFGIVPFQSGGAGGKELADAQSIKLEPGSMIAIPLVSGDADLSACGTVTDVVGDKVIAFGHAFFGEGELDLPMGTAYVHTVVSSMFESFKLASPVKMLGSLTQDQTVAVSGSIGRKATTIPMTVTVNWSQTGKQQVFNYEVCRHNFLTPLAVSYLLESSVSGWRALPEQHTVRYSVAIDFDKLGAYRTENITTREGANSLISDVVRPVFAMMHNPYGPSAKITRIEVAVAIDSGECSAAIKELKLDGKAYHPGETIRGTLTIQPYRKERKDIPVEIALPRDLPQGQYQITVCDWTHAAEATHDEMPHLFAPKTSGQLLGAINASVATRGNLIYVRMPLKRGGVALSLNELPDLPPSRAAILSRSNPLDAHDFTKSLVQTVQTCYVLSGSTDAAIEVTDNFKEIPVRQDKESK